MAWVSFHLTSQVMGLKASSLHVCCEYSAVIHILEELSYHESDASYILWADEYDNKIDLGLISTFT